jgi:predicted alpha/beta hydrolase
MSTAENLQDPGPAVEVERVAASDGHSFELRWWPATHPRSDAIFVICPAMGVRASYYDRVGEAFASSGVTAVITEIRGQDTSSLRASRRTDWGYEHHVTLDWPAARAAVRERNPKARVFFLGHSLGAQISALYAARFPDEVAGIVFVAAATVYFRSWRFPDNVKLLAQTQVVAALATGLGYFPGRRFGFAGLQARTEMRDWARNARLGTYALTGAAFDYDRALAAMPKPVWGFSLDGDDFAPEAGMAHLVSKFRTALSVHRHLTAADVPPEALNHFAWTKKPEAIVARILKETDITI